MTMPRRPRLPQISVWPDLPDLVHGFLGRRGGVSVAPFDELNLSPRVEDQPAAVAANWNRLAATLPLDSRFARIHQVHGNTIVRADDLGDHEPAADALITARRGLILGILTADCVPILLVDPQTRAVAAVHAGWRGTVAGIATRAVQMLVETYRAEPAHVRAALGPSIGSCCYEVGDDIVDQVQQHAGTIPKALTPSPRAGHQQLDLRAVNAHLLRAAGVRDIEEVGPCTRCAAAEYFSHRHASRPGGEGSTGRQLSYIGWS